MSSKVKSSAETGGGAALVPKLRFPEFREAGGWTDKPLSTAATINPPNSGLPETFIYIDLESVDSGTLKSRNRISRLEAPSRAQRVVENGDIIYQVVRPYQRNNLLCSFNDGQNYVASTGYAQIRARGSNFFLYQSIHTDLFVERVIAKCTGSNYPAINSSDLAGIHLPLPSTLAEQQKIADCLASADALIAAQGRKVEALRAHKKGLMQQLFPQEGETQPRLRFPEFKGAGEWIRSTIGEFKPFVTSGSRGWAAFYAEKGDLFIRITNLWRNSICLDLSDKKFIQLPTDASEGTRTQLKKSDVLISITADIGIVGYVDESVPSPAYINQHIALVRFEEGQLCSKFVAYFLASEGAQRLFRASTDNGTKAGMNLTGIQNIGLSIPSISEQQRIADCLTSLDDLIAAETRKLNTLKTHKKGLMQQLFPQLRDDDR